MITASYIIAIIWFFLILERDVISDYNKWVKKESINHSREALTRTLYLLPCFGLLVWHKLDHKTILQIIPIVFTVSVLMFSVWWELFDGWYNRKRGLRWRFNGTVDPDDSKLDIFLNKINDTWEAVLKWGLIGGSLITYILIE